MTKPHTLIEWWRDPRCHFGRLDESSPVLIDRSDLQPAIAFIVARLALKPGDNVLDLCCGPGRYVIELARRGFSVVGIDLNEEYIALARNRAEKEGIAAQLLTGDMRDISYVDRFDAILNVGSSFGYFDAKAEDQRTIDLVGRALKPGGRFLLEMGNRDFLLKNFEAASAFENPDGSVTMVRRCFDYARSRIDTTFQRSANDELLETWSHSWRAYTLAEVVDLLARAGLHLVGAGGGWNSEPYDVDARRMVVIAQKRAVRWR